MEIVIASRNLHKIREIRAILKGQYPFDFLSLLDFPDYEPPEETGATFEENAFIKATHAADALKRWVLADDSGLVVPALNDDPGVRSARYAGENATDKENRTKLIKALDGLEESKRIGYYVCAIALSSPDGIQTQVKGMCEGSLILTSRGSQGFGYDPLFLKYDYNKTFAELDEETKNKISHRRKALDKLMPAFEALLQKH
ncbi:RdgB/HAM1 family non-canonical purine NTP pyrophosphatase [Candidatus Neptunochlamydia vexilliferae]|uniref:dITP/XTP pyrophosphatase n=1 Tax=Candidatus Neptunichlamydia vexilliferae TaxID=1651774 RepID=A0ABS0B195_9BACT|nr:RdgB/HAM1 family non-canonical purine NTP pyrophosphatase [Candidatus Neptunochlamydia vexilliferae]MBF5060147.1 Non-canonical purine NTP pyrophosphatase [Candidatus Neptunochlamydia vexilliferae]